MPVGALPLENKKIEIDTPFCVRNWNCNLEKGAQPQAPIQGLFFVDGLWIAHFSTNWVDDADFEALFFCLLNLVFAKLMVIAHSKSKMHWKMALLLFFIILSRDWEREQRELFKVCHCHICLLFRSIWTTRSSCNRVVFLTWQGTKWKGEIQEKIPPHPKLYNCSFLATWNSFRHSLTAFKE